MQSTTAIVLLWLLLAVYGLTVLGVITTVLSENRNPLKATAWILIVGFVPVVGLLSYVLFGQSQRRLYRIHQRVYRRLMGYPDKRCLHTDESDDFASLEARYLPLAHLLRESAGSELVSYSSADIFTNGEEMYKRLFEDIRSAQEHIHLQAYIFEEGELFDQLTTLLIEKAQAGVSVRLLYDYLGSYSVDTKRWKALQSRGIQLYPFLPVYLPLLSSTVNYRNHRKVIVIDGQVGYVGGMNFADRYIKGNKLGQWRDTHFRLEGEAVMPLQGSFLIDWYTASRRILSTDGLFPHYPPSSLPQAELPRAQFVRGGPMDSYPLIEQTLVRLITNAQRSVYLQTPYFLPTETLYSAILIATLSGVDVRLMIPDRGDNRLVSLATDSYLNELLEAGLKVYRYSAGFLHSKLLLIDGELSAIGSANLDFRSLEHNFEITGILYDKALTTRLEEIYLHDLEQSTEVHLSEWSQRPRRIRQAESIARLFSPLL